METVNAKKLRATKNQLSEKLLDSSLSQKEFIKIRSLFYKADFDLFIFNKKKLVARRTQSVVKNFDVSNQLAA